MVVAGVKGLELLVAEIENGFGVAAAVVVIGGGRKQPALQRQPQALHRRAERAFHFVEHHALERQFRIRIVGVGEFQPVAFLGEIPFVQQRKKGRVQINIQQVVEILFVLTGEGVGGPIAAGEGVHEGVERTPDHHEKRIAHRIAPAAAQRGVFENVRHAGRILRHGQKSHHEGVVRVVGGEVQVPRAGGGVAVFLKVQLEGGDSLTACEFEGGMAHGFGSGGSESESEVGSGSAGGVAPRGSVKTTRMVPQKAINTPTGASPSRFKIRLRWPLPIEAKPMTRPASVSAPPMTTIQRPSRNGFTSRPPCRPRPDRRRGVAGTNPRF